MDKECCNIDEIKRLIPHRYPFLLIDKVIDIVKNESAIGIKNVTALLIHKILLIIYLV